ncbi:MAG: DUF805 domain-containing protein [Akkermansia sp.]
MPDSRYPATPATPASPAVSAAPQPSSSLPPSCWKKASAVMRISGPTSRAEFWWFMALPLLALIPALAGYILTDWLHIPDTRLSIYGDALTILLWAVLFIPSISAAFRRLHDTGRSGLWLFSPFIPFGLGHLIFFYLTLGESKADGNKYSRRAGARRQTPPLLPENGKAAFHAVLPLLAHQPAEIEYGGRPRVPDRILVLFPPFRPPVPSAGLQHDRR